MRGNHTVLKLSILEWASAIASSVAQKEIVMSAVAEIFQINKANKFLQKESHTYKIYHSP